MDISPDHSQIKSIECGVLPDEQLIAISTKYPFYTRANVEVYKRIYKDANHNLSHLKDRVLLYVSNVQLFQCALSNENQSIEEIPSPVISDPGEPSSHSIIPVEPLHTVDYFLSQGIKITEENLSNDKLGSQLKSFTDWLKSMKKVHQKLPHEAENTDKVIQTIAEHSNEAAAVETEAMAEVLIRQGKRLQAFEIYEKLSLKNPSESAYFAAKIKSLKQI